MLPRWLDVAFAAGSLAMAVVETLRWRRSRGQPTWVAFYAAIGFAFLAFALFER